MPTAIRNLAIIAHVDHGKTTLVDGLLKQTHTFRDNQAEMQQTTILDRNELEREKGITILAKNTAVQYQDTKINIIDTPGHADFSGEVERVINMADGALLIVDSAEGPLPQTRFVLEQALKQKLKIIVVINKIDRKDARPEEVLRETEELFLHLAESDDALDFPVIFAVGREGKAWKEMPTDFSQPGDLVPLIEQIIETIPAPQASPEKPFKMLVSTLDFDPYKGIYAIGKVTQGIIKPGQKVVRLAENELQGTHTVAAVFASQGLGRVEVAESIPGDIIALTGISGLEIGETLADPIDPTGYPMIRLTEPTLKIYIGPNTSPFAGREGQALTARQLKERLDKELQTNIGLRVEPNPTGQGFMVAGRGELHLAILIESLRREGSEIEVGKPQIIEKMIDGVASEPFEEVTIEVDQEYMGAIVEEMGKRRGQMTDSKNSDKGTARMIFEIPSKNILGFRSEMLSKTRGTGMLSSRFIGYKPRTASIAQLRNGALIASESGTSTTYALEMVQERGITFIGPAVPVYEGMIVGLCSRQEDIEMNVCKEKKLTNFRSNADMMVHLNTPTQLSLEQSLDFLEEDELLEVTPETLRIRKRLLSNDARIKDAKRRQG